MSRAGPWRRARENLTGIVSVLHTGIWLAALFTGQDWWLPFMLVGYVVVIPLVALLFGDEDDVEEWWDDEVETEPREDDSDVESKDEALETLRERYARGELTEEQFERKLDRLLDVETIEDVEDLKREREREPE